MTSGRTCFVLLIRSASSGRFTAVRYSITDDAVPREVFQGSPPMVESIWLPKLLMTQLFLNV